MARFRRPPALSQRGDPSEAHIQHENNGCTATSAAAALNAHTNGSVALRGGFLRHSLANPDGRRPGSTLGLDDAQDMWRRAPRRIGKASQTLLLGAGWAGIKQRRLEGRCVIIQGDSGNLDGSCSESQDVAHAILLHPDDGPRGEWLIMDPWCYVKGSRGVGKWRWIDQDDVRAYATKLDYAFAFTKRLPKIA